MTTKNALIERACWPLPFGTSDVDDVQLVYVIELNNINICIETFLIFEENVKKMYILCFRNPI